MTHSGGFMNMSRRIVMAVGLSMVLVAPQSFAAQEASKVGVVDSGKILQLLPETKQAEASLQSAAAPLQKEIAIKNQEFQKAVAEYKKQAASLKPAAREQKEKELTLKSQALQKFQQEQNLAFEKKQQEIFAPIRQKLNAAIESSAQKEGFGVVIDKNVPVYFTPENDLTFKVINQLNIK